MMKSLFTKALRCRILASNLQAYRKIFSVRPMECSVFQPQGDKASSTKMVSFIATPDTISRIYQIASYEDVRDVSKRNNVWLIDVRDKHEIKRSGTIPCAINIALDELRTALTVTPEYFLNRYGVTKPYFDSEIIFTCRTGRRSKIAYELAESMGYKNLKNFDGGWLLYEERCDFG